MDRFTTATEAGVPTGSRSFDSGAANAQTDCAAILDRLDKILHRVGQTESIVERLNNNLFGERPEGENLNKARSIPDGGLIGTIAEKVDLIFMRLDGLDTQVARLERLA